MILSCSGHSPFQLRLLKGVIRDFSSLSKRCLCVRDPLSLSQLESKSQVKKNSEAYKKEIEGEGVILPSTVDHFSGRRTDMTIYINNHIPKESLMFWKSTFITCPDVLQLIVDLSQVV